MRQNTSWTYYCRRTGCVRVWTAQFCVKLSLPGNATLNSDLVIYSTVVTSTCNRGFILTDGNLSRPVECVEGNYSVVWNDTIDDCQRNYRQRLSDQCHTCNFARNWCSSTTLHVWHRSSTAYMRIYRQWRTQDFTLGYRVSEWVVS